jgi:hypothetical protein
MSELRIPFVLWLPGDAAPDLSSMAAPVRIPIWLHLDHQLPEQAASSGLSKAKDDANA